MAADRNLPGHGRRPHLLDPASRQATRGFTVRATLFLAYAVSPWLSGARPVADVLVRLTVAFTLGSLVATVMALLRGDRVGRGGLNRWDEAMAFNGVALLAHLLLPVVAHG